MKFLHLIYIMLFATATVTAQEYRYPMASPRQTISQQFSVTKITIDYSRPAVRERKIFGELVPFGKIWRAGANEATNITFGQDVLFGGKSVKKGSYAIFITPQEKEWTVVLNYDADAWGSFSYDPNDNIIEVKTPVVPLKELQERLEFSFEGISNEKVYLTIKWEHSMIEIPIEVDKTDEINKIIDHLKEIQQIEREMEM